MQAGSLARRSNRQGHSAGANTLQDHPRRAIKKNPEAGGSDTPEKRLVKKVNPKVVHVTGKIKRCAAISPKVMKTNR